MALTRERIRYPPTVGHAIVSRVIDVTPAMRRVTLTGDDLTGFASEGPADRVKVFFPNADTGEAPAPTLTGDGTFVPPAGTAAARDFTPSRSRVGDSGHMELDLDFFLHPHAGPASRPMREWEAAWPSPDRAALDPLLLDDAEDQRRRGSSSPARKTVASLRIGGFNRSAQWVL